MLQKIIYALIPAVTFLFLFASCNRDDMPGTEPGQTLLPQKIHFEMVYAVPDNGATDTRVAISTDGNYANTWQEGDEVGVIIIDDNQGYDIFENPVRNMKMTYRDGSWEYTLPDNCTYYPKDRTLSFIAYLPYVDDQYGPFESFYVNLGSLADGNKWADIFLYAKTENVCNTSEPVTLNFSPVKACIELSVKGGNDRIVTKLKGCSINFDFYLETGVLRTDNDKRQMELPRIGNIYRAFLCPQTIASGTELFTFEDKKNNRTWTYRTTEDVTLKAGEVKPFEITLVPK